MPSIYPKDKNDRKSEIYFAYMKDGKRIAFPLKHPRTGENLRNNPQDRIIAEQVKRELERDLNHNTKIRYWNLKLSTAWERFRNTKDHILPRSQASYITVQNKMIEYFGDKYIPELTEKELNDIVDHWKHKHAHNTAVTYERYMKFFLSWLFENQYIKFKYQRRLNFKPSRIRVIKEEHFKIIFDYLKKYDTDLYRFYTTLALTGRRLGEINRMKWEDVDWTNKILYIRNRKANREDQFPLYKALEEHLKSFKKDKGQVFTAGYEKYKKSLRRVIDIINDVREEKELAPIPNYKVHEIRKTFATNLVNKKMPIIDAAEILGHKDIGTTRKFYTAVNLDRLRSELEK